VAFEKAVTGGGLRLEVGAGLRAGPAGAPLRRQPDQFQLVGDLLLAVRDDQSTRHRADGHLLGRGGGQPGLPHDLAVGDVDRLHRSAVVGDRVVDVAASRSFEAAQPLQLPQALEPGQAVGRELLRRLRLAGGERDREQGDPPAPHRCCKLATSRVDDGGDSVASLPPWRRRLTGPAVTAAASGSRRTWIRRRGRGSQLQLLLEVARVDVGITGGVPTAGGEGQRARVQLPRGQRQPPRVLRPLRHPRVHVRAHPADRR
jgi:hypothetical protein